MDKMRRFNIIKNKCLHRLIKDIFSHIKVMRLYKVITFIYKIFENVIYCINIACFII